MLCVCMWYRLQKNTLQMKNISTKIKIDCRFWEAMLCYVLFDYGVSCLSVSEPLVRQKQFERNWVFFNECLLLCNSSTPTSDRLKSNLFDGSTSREKLCYYLYIHVMQVLAFSTTLRDSIPSALIVFWTAYIQHWISLLKVSSLAGESTSTTPWGVSRPARGVGCGGPPQYRLSPGVKTRPRGHAWSKQPDLKQHFIRPSTEAFPQEGRYRTH